MAIITTNPMDIFIKLVGDRNLTQDEMFKLAQHIDAYEIEKGERETIVIDIKKLTKDGSVVIYMTPRGGGLTYENISKHVKSLMEFAIPKAGLNEFKWEIEEFTTDLEAPGTPSYVSNLKPKHIK
jgi:hypothetical protein